jgi:hypothetical protein
MVIITWWTYEKRHSFHNTQKKETNKKHATFSQ